MHSNESFDINHHKFQNWLLVSRTLFLSHRHIIRLLVWSNEIIKPPPPEPYQSTMTTDANNFSESIQVPIRDFRLFIRRMNKAIRDLDYSIQNDNLTQFNLKPDDLKKVSDLIHLKVMHEISNPIKVDNNGNKVKINNSPPTSSHPNSDEISDIFMELI